MLHIKDGHKNARSRPVMLADRSHWNVVPFGKVYLLQMEFQGYCIWLCVREVNRIWNCKLLLRTLCRRGGISAPQQKSLSKPVGANAAIFHDLVCTMWYSFRVSLTTVVPLPSQNGSWWSLILILTYSDSMWHNYTGWTKTLFQFMCSYINPFIIIHFFHIFSVFQCLHELQDCYLKYEKLQSSFRCCIKFLYFWYMNSFTNPFPFTLLSLPFGICFSTKGTILTVLGL